MSARAVITGVGTICSLARTSSELHDALLEGRCGIQPINNQFDTEGLGCHAIAPMVEFDPTHYLSRRQANMLDLLSWATLDATHQALDDAGNPQASRPERSGVVVASTYPTTGNLLEFFREAASVGMRRANPVWLRNAIPSTTMMLCAIQHDLQGVNLTVASGETAGIDGLLHCCNALQTNTCDMMLLVGSESVFSDLQRYFDRLQILAHGGQAVPYGQRSTGAVLGECAAALVLERADGTRSDRPVLCEVLAVASRSGDPARALRHAIEAVLAESHVDTREVQFIIGAGNGNPRQDGIEASVLSEVFGAGAVLTSIKGAIGECLSAAGLSSIITAIQAGGSGKLPPVHALDAVLDSVKLDVVSQQPAAVGHGVALVCTIGHLGGAAVALLAV